MRISDWSSDVCSSDLARAALEGARAILIERWGEDAALVGELREWLSSSGVIRARVAAGKEDAGAKYRDYFDHAEPLAKIPSHRLLALLRGRREEFLQLDLDPGADVEAGNAYAEGRVALHARSEEHTSELQPLMRNP